jgi:hypothetical protein
MLSVKQTWQVYTVACPGSAFKKERRDFLLDELVKDMLFLLHGLLEGRSRFRFMEKEIK